MNSCNGTPSGNSAVAATSRAAAGSAIGLYLDTAVGVDAGGADAWIDQAVMLRGLSVGAPPDQYQHGRARTGA